jgi:hypothetical protein
MACTRACGRRRSTVSVRHTEPAGPRVGPLITGRLADRYGLPRARAVMPVACGVAALAFWYGPGPLRQRLRRRHYVDHDRWRLVSRRVIAFGRCVGLRRWGDRGRARAGEEFDHREHDEQPSRDEQDRRSGRLREEHEQQRRQRAGPIRRPPWRTFGAGPAPPAWRRAVIPRGPVGRRVCRGARVQLTGRGRSNSERSGDDARPGALRA